jgi:hypothetical protein
LHRLAPHPADRAQPVQRGDFWTPTSPATPDALQRITPTRSAVVRRLDGSATYRLPLVLRYQELDYDAIGEILGVTRNQVGTLLFRAKKRLRAELAPGGTR